MGGLKPVSGGLGNPTEVEGPERSIYPSSVPQVTGPSSGHSTSLGYMINSLPERECRT